MLALAILPGFEAEAAAGKAQASGERRGRKRSHVAELPHEPGLARDRAARTVGVSGRAVQQAKFLDRHARDLADLVRSGALSLDMAEKRARRRVAHQREQDARQVTLDAVKADAEGPGWELFCGEFQSRLGALEDGSVDAVIADPPYNADSLSLLSDMAKHAARLLKPQGLLIALMGQLFLPEVLSRFSEHLDYGWTYAQPLGGLGTRTSRIMGRHVLQAWKPWVVFSNGRWPSGAVDFHGDVIGGSLHDVIGVSRPPSKRFRWRQSGQPAAYLLDHLTRPGDIVLDPVAGEGTFGVEAIRLRRKFIGVELDSERFRRAARALTAASA